MSWFEDLFINEAKPALGRHSGSGGGSDNSVWLAILARSITELDNSEIVTLGKSAFREARLTKINLPNLETAGASCFLDNYFTSVCFPKLKTIDASFLQDCDELTMADLGTVTRLPSYAFRNDENLNAIILRKMDDICSLSATSCFNNTPFASGGTGGTVYVPSALIESYQTATNWSTLYAAGTCSFVAIEGSEYE